MIIFDVAIMIILFTNLAFMAWGYKYLVMLFHMLEDGENTGKEKETPCSTKP